MTYLNGEFIDIPEEESSIEEKRPVPKFSVRLKGKHKGIYFHAPQDWGRDAKVYFREYAVRYPEYHYEIDCKIHGYSKKENKKIPISTVGRWLFGVEGYSGHILMKYIFDKGCWEAVFPAQSHTFVKNLIKKVVRELNDYYGPKEKEM